jgi:hypothetical protein
MGSSTGFHPDPKARKAAEEIVQVLPAQLSLQRRLLVIVNTMQLKTLLDVSIPMRVRFPMGGSLV